MHRIKFPFGIIRHDDRAADPLAVNLAPSEFRPPGVGRNEMQPAVAHLMPVGRCDVAERIGVIVNDQLWHPGCAGGEISKHQVVDIRRRFACGARKIRRAVRDGATEIDAVRGDCFTDNRNVPKRRTCRAHLPDVAEQFSVVDAADHLDARLVAAVFNIVRHELEGRRDHDRADAVQRQHAHPRLDALLEHQQNEIALLHAVRREKIGCLHRKRRQLREGEPPLARAAVHPDERGLFCVLTRPLVDHIV